MSKSKIYVGNLSYSTDENGLRDYFSQYGNIEECNVISDFQTGRSKGFAFITFSSDQEGENALAANGVELDGRQLRVNTATDNGRGGRRGGAGGGAGGRGGHQDRDRY